MMVRPVRTATAYLGTGDGTNLSFMASIRTDRDIVPGSEIFRVKKGDHTYFVGRADIDGVVGWIRRASGKKIHAPSTYCRTTGQFQVTFCDGAPEPGEELSVSYKWRPHALSGALVMVHVNGEDRFVPIRDLQQALGTDLGDE